MALQVGCQGLELVLKEQHTTPRNLIMATKLIHCRYLELDSTAGPLSKALVLCPLLAVL